MRGHPPNVEKLRRLHMGDPPRVKNGARAQPCEFRATTQSELKIEQIINDHPHTTTTHHRVECEIDLARRERQHLEEMKQI